MGSRRHLLAVIAAAVPLALPPSTSRADGEAVTSVHPADVFSRLFKVFASDGEAHDDFGISVAMHDGLIVVGSPFHDNDKGSAAGSAYVFDAPTGRQLHQLLSADGGPGDFLGYAVATDGDRIVAGAIGDRPSGISSGSAYLFDAARGVQIAKLVASDGSAFDEFGSVVAISGGTILVSAYRDSDVVDRAGAVYVFDAGTGRQRMKLTASDPGPVDFFGLSVDLTRHLAVISARRKAYVFDLKTGAELRRLMPEDPTEPFGGEVACIDDRAALIAAAGDNEQGEYAGAVYRVDLMTGEFLEKILLPGGEAFDLFGASVDVWGSRAIIGADPVDRPGSQYLFDISSTARLLGRVSSDRPAPDDRFGACAAIDHGLVVVGDRNDDELAEDAGAAHVFTVSSCPADLDQSGGVDGSDLLVVLAAWRTALGDVNGDGTTDVEDLLAVLSAWGACE